MYTEADKQLILKFLELNYPVSRIKFNHKFRRAIVLESGVFLLGDGGNANRLKFELAAVVNKVFNCDDTISCAILDNFLNLK